MAACGLAGGWLWVRDSKLVAVRDVFITGVDSAEAPQIRSALRNAALDMTTLHVREDALHAAVAQYPSVKAFDVEADFPRKLTIVVHERAAVAAIRSRGSAVAASRDGLVLRGMRARGLPTLRVRSTPAGERVTDRRTLGALAVAGGAPAELRDRIARLWSGPRGPDPRPARRPGPRLRLRRGRRAQVGGGRPCARRSELRGRHLPRSAGARTSGRRRPRTRRTGARSGGPGRP